MNVEPTSKSTEEVQTQKRKLEMNQFLFSVVNQFNLDEFKKYTNVRELVRNALEKHDPSRMDSLERYIQLNFEQNLPVEKVWKNRGFASLLLTSDFYESETSERVFHNIFGIKKCKVFVGPIDDNKTEVDMSKAEEINLHPDDEKKSEVIDLTTDEHHDSNDHIYPPKRRKKNQLIPKVLSTCLSEPSKTSLPSNDVQPSKPKIGPKSRVKRDNSPYRPQVLSNYQPSTFAPKTSQTSLRNDKTQPPKPKVGPKSRVRRDSSPDSVQQGLLNNQSSTCIPESSKTSLPSNDVQPSKPRIGPKSRVKRDSPSDCRPQVLSNNQPPTFTPKTSQTTLRNDKTQPPKPKVGPKSRVRRDSSPDCVQQGLSNNQSSTCIPESSKTSLPSNDVQPSKPRIGPKSRVKRVSSPDSVQQGLSNNQSSTCIPEASKTSLLSDDVQPSKPRVKQDSSPDCVQQGLSNNQSSTCIPESSKTSLLSDDVQPSEPVIGPKSRVKRDSVQQGLSNNQTSTYIPESSKTSVLSDDVQPSKPKIRPKSRVKRDSSPDCRPQVFSTNQPSTFTSQTSLRSHKPQPSKPKIGPKSRIKHDAVSNCLSKVLSENQPPTVFPQPSEASLQSNNVHASKPKIPPKSNVKQDNQSDCLPRVLLENQSSTTLPKLSEASLESNNVQTSKSKIDKLRVREDTLTDCLSKVLSENQPSQVLPKLSEASLLCNDVQASKPKIGPRSRVKQDILSDCLPKDLSGNQPSICLPIPSQTSVESNDDQTSKGEISLDVIDVSLTPFKTRDSISVESTATPINPFISTMKELPTNIIIDNPSDVVSTSPTEEDICQLPSLSSFTQSFCTQLSSIENQFEKYLNITHPSNLSLKQFWLDFLILEYENGEPSDGALKSISNSGSDQEMSPTILNSNLNVSSTNTPKNNSMKTCDIEKEAKISEELNQKDSSSSDVEIIETSNSAIDITNDCTQNLLNNLRVDHDETLEQVGFVGRFALPQYCRELVISSISMGCHNNEKPLNITMEPPTNISAVSNHNIEKHTVPNESQIQRYNLLSYDNSMFLSSQLANFELNAGKRTIGPMTPQEAAVKTMKRRFGHQQSCPTINLKPSKLKLLFQDQYTSAQKSNVIHKLHWKFLNIKTAVFEPLSMNTFNLELQLRNNFDKFYLNDQQSIKQLLNVNDSEWKHIVNVLKVLGGYTYDVFNSLALQKSDLLHRIMNYFMKSIPLFVKSHVQFRDFMGNLLEVNQHQPLPNKCVNSAIDPSVLKQMIEFKKKNENKVD